MFVAVVEKSDFLSVSFTKVNFKSNFISVVFISGKLSSWTHSNLSKTSKYTMDADSNDGTATEALNGETKPDVAKLAQSAIIKQVSLN